MTNADKIRSMTNEQLAKTIADIRSGDCCFYCGHNQGIGYACDGNCDDGLLIWLLQEADNE